MLGTRTVASGRRRWNRGRIATLEPLEDRWLLSATPPDPPDPVETIFAANYQIDQIPTSNSTRHKPQSKVWSYDDRWWTVTSDDSGTWVRRLDGLSWTPVLSLSPDEAKADIKPVGDVVHVLLYEGPAYELVSVQYVPGVLGTYQLWPQRPFAVDVLYGEDVEVATIDVDSTGRMWMASDTPTDIEVRYSDFPYDTWSDPIVVASGITSDDISVVTALPDNSIGVLWSDQQTERFGFRIHADADAPDVWSADEVPASQSALDFGDGMADDHLNVAVASDGTLYAAVKTSYNKLGETEIALLVRRPTGIWDPLYEVDTLGTRPIVVVSEAQNRLLVAYRASGRTGPIVYRESLLSTIAFGPQQMLIPDMPANDVSSTKGSFTDQIVFIAAGGGQIFGSLLSTVHTINLPPSVDAGGDQTIYEVETATLDATVSDAGLPDPPTAVTTAWSVVSSPNTGPEQEEGGVFPLGGPIDVFAAAESDPIQEIGDALDDPAIWVHPTDSSQSLIIGADKKSNGLWIYDLSGQEIDFIGGGQANNVDVRYNFSLGGELVDLVSITDRTTDTIQIYKVDPQLRTLIHLGTIQTGISVYGYGMYHNQTTGKFYGFVTSKTGDVEQWEFIDLGNGQVGGVNVRTFDVGGQTEGVVADDELQVVYFGEETVGIWKYGANPEDETQRTQVDQTGPGGHLAADVEGLAIYHRRGGQGYLIASSQGDNTYAVYRREGNNDFLASFQIADGAVDGTVVTDGLEVANMPLGDLYPQGMLVVQDGHNDDGNQNFKFVPWEEIAGKLGLAIDTIVDVRGGQTPQTAGVTFGDRSAIDTTAQFAQPGNYVLRLTASDGELQAMDEAAISVVELPPNQAPIVDAGVDQTIFVSESATLDATATDDGFPLPGNLTSNWSVASGPTAAVVTFADPSALSTAVSFSTIGQYVLRLTVDDGQLQTFAEVTVTVEFTPEMITLSLQDGLDGYDGTRDTRVRSDLPTRNFGDSSKLEIDGNPDFSSLIQWDLSAIPTDVTVLSASIAVNVIKTSSDLFELYQIKRPWVELEATFNEASAGTPWEVPGASGVTDRGTTVLGTITSPLTAVATVDLNADGIAVVQSWIADPATNYGLIFQDYANATTDDLDFNSRETGTIANRPMLTVTYSPAPLAPVFSPIGDKSLNEENLLSFTVAATDPDESPLIYSADGLPPGATFDPATRAFDWTPSESQDGSYEVTFSVYDGTFTVSETITITVGEVNQLPVLLPIGAKSIDEGDPLSFTIVATDADLVGGLPNTLSYNATGLPTGATWDSLAGVFDWTPSEDQDGTHNVTFSVDDGTQTVSETITITVSEVNQAPVMSPVGGKSVDEGQQLSFTLDTVDADQVGGLPNTLSYAADSLPSGASLDSTDGTFTWTPSDGQAGTYNVTFSVDDGTDTDSETITITVIDVDQAPLLTPIGDKSVNEENLLSFTVAATDPEQGPLTYSADGLPPGATFDPATQAFDWTPSESQDGTYEVTFNVDDGAATASETIAITVAEVNQLPVLLPIGAKSTDEGDLLSFTIVATDGDLVGGLPNTLTYTADGLPAGATLDPAAGTFNWTPAEAQEGSYSVTLHVDDGTSVVSETIAINVAEVNQPPVPMPIGDKSVDEGSLLTFTMAATDGDLVGGLPNTLTYTAAGLPAGATFDPLTGNFDWTPADGQFGVYNTTFSVDDGTATVFETITITVVQVNQTPILTPIGDKSVDEGSPLAFTISATDAEQDPLTYSATGLPAGAAWDPVTRAFAWTPGEDQDGTYNVIFSATDATTTVSETIAITVVEVNTAAVLAPIGNKSLDEGSSLSFTISATDGDLVDGLPNTLTYAVSGLPAGATLDAATGVFNFTPAEDQDGLYNATFSVDDGTVLVSETISIVVGEVNQPPVLVPIGDKSVDEGSSLSFTVSATDGDLVGGLPNTLTYLAVGLPVGATFDSGSQTFNWTPSDGQAGTHAVTFNVDDGVATISETIAISVVEIDQAPVLAPIGNQSIDEGSPLSITISAADPDQDPMTYWASGLPAGSTFDPVTRTFDWTPSENQDGTYSVTFSVADGSTTVSETIAIAVGEVNQLPLLLPIGDRLAEEGQELSFAIAAIDSDLVGGLPNVLSFTADALPSGAILDSAGGTFTWSPADGQAGAYVVTFGVNDGTASDFETITITVGPRTQPITQFFQDGVSSDSTYAGTRDTRIKAGKPTRNYGSFTELQIDGSPDKAALFKWDIGSISAGSTVRSATLTINVIGKTNDTYEVYGLVRDWVESEATWNEFSAGNSWETAGADGPADRDSVVLAAVTAPSAGLHTFAFNAAGIAAIQAWVDNPAENYGIIIQDYTAASDGLDLASRETAVVTNRPKLTVAYMPNGGSPLLAGVLEASAAGQFAPLTERELQPIVDAALMRWNAKGFGDKLSPKSFLIYDLPGSMLGLAVADTIYIDRDAAGFGWFVDTTPYSDDEFRPGRSGGELTAVDPLAVDRIDLLSVVLHELGHTLGLDDLDASADDLMNGLLPLGVRRIPGPAEIDAVLVDSVLEDA